MENMTGSFPYQPYRMLSQRKFELEIINARAIWQFDFTLLKDFVTLGHQHRALRVGHGDFYLF
jgi:hypothetical protein